MEIAGSNPAVPTGTERLNLEVPTNIDRVASMSSPTKVCTRCGVEKSVEEFQTRLVEGRRYPRTRCAPCENQLRRIRRTPEARARLQKRSHAKISRQRAENVNRARWVLKDSRASDRKHSRPNDLDYEFVEAALSEPCRYCGSRA